MLDHTHFNPDGWKARADRAAARLAANRSPKTHAVRKARAAISALEDVDRQARADWAKLHAPVPCPVTKTGAMHPHMAALIVTFLAERGLADHDPLAPIEAGISCEDFVDEATARAKAELDAAYAELAEVERRDALFAEIVSAGPEGIEALLAGRTDASEAPAPTLSNVTTEADISAALDHDDMDEDVLIVDDDVPVLPPRRGPGRPRRVDLDDDVPA